MSCKIGDLRNKQVVCVKNGCVLGFVSDVEINTGDGKIESLVIFGRPRFFGLFGREEDIIIPWNEISVIGHETVLVNTDPEPYIRLLKRNRYTV
jgi:YlmC/YmxH family sporulation protein